MSTTPLKVSLIGCGKMGINHLKAIKSTGLGEVVAIADPIADSDKISEILSHPIPLFKDAQTLLEEVKPDVVHIVTPPDSHYQLARMVLEKGSHVYIEKPFVSKDSEAQDIFNLAKTNNLQVCAGHQLIGHPVTKTAKEYVRHIGKVVHIESYFSFRMVRKNITKAEQLIDILPHPVYTLLHFLSDNDGSIDNTQPELKEFIADPAGEIRALIQHNGISGVLVVTLSGRPVDSYLRIVGTHGSIYIDYVRGVVVNLPGQSADVIGALMMPYRQGIQGILKTTSAIASLFLKKHKSYGGLSELISGFYSSILQKGKNPLNQNGIVNTVYICGRIADKLKGLENRIEAGAQVHLEANQQEKSGVTGEVVLVTGGAGFLGKTVTQYLKNHGHHVRATSRRLVPYSARVPGVEYAKVDLSRDDLREMIKGVSAVIHCAAETAGGKEDHMRNSIEATKRIFEAAQKEGVLRFIHISSLGILKPGGLFGKPLNENSPVEIDNLGRGPYVWGKAESERWLTQASNNSALKPKIIRPGPLVDYINFEAPGRLGREMGPIFLVMGSKKSSISICDVWTVAKIVHYYLDHYESAPLVLNAVEPQSTTRKDIAKKILLERSDIKFIYVPTTIVKAASVCAKILQKLIFPSKKPIDVAAAFSSEKYDTTLVRNVVKNIVSD